METIQINDVKEFWVNVSDMSNFNFLTLANIFKADRIEVDKEFDQTYLIFKYNPLGIDCL